MYKKRKKAPTVNRAGRRRMMLVPLTSLWLMALMKLYGALLSTGLSERDRDIWQESESSQSTKKANGLKIDAKDRGH